MEGLAGALEDPYYLPYGQVELTVVQFASNIVPNFARVEVATTTIDCYETAHEVAEKVRAMVQAGGYTSMASGIHLAADTLVASPNFDPGACRQHIKQVLNIFTDGMVNFCDPSFPCPDAYTNAICARDYALEVLLGISPKVEIDVEGYCTILWMKNAIVYPQPGNLAPPFEPGWVFIIEDIAEYVATVGIKFGTLSSFAKIRMAWGDEEAQCVYYGEGYLLPSGRVGNFQTYLVKEATMFRALWGGSVDLCTHGGSVYVTWIERSDYLPPWQDFMVWFAKSDDGGRTWSGPLSIFYTGWMEGGEHHHVASSARIRADPKGKLFVAFFAGRLDNPKVLSDIFLFGSFDDGDSWSGKGFRPQLCSEHIDMELDHSGNIYVGYCRYAAPPNVFYVMKSMDHGETFGADVLASPGISCGYGELDLEIGKNGFVHLIGLGDVIEGDREQPCHWVSEDDGDTFVGPHLVDPVTGEYEPCPLADGSMYVFWYDGEANIRRSCSSDYGYTWGRSILIKVSGGALDPRFHVGARAALGRVVNPRVPGVIFYQYFGDAAPLLRCGGLTSLDGIAWADHVVFPYPEGDRFLQGSVLSDPNYLVNEGIWVPGPVEYIDIALAVGA